jgi:LmbE family N-acetylglucosaminyl deacetylase
MGPDGMTGHSDHIAVSAWVTAAVRQYGGGAQLHYATVLPEVWAKMGEEFFRLGISMGGQPSITEGDALSIHYALDDEMLATKRRALLAQASQVEQLFEVIDQAAIDLNLRHETYRLAGDLA